jgi:iron(III) transport system substrate-binding protein
LFRELQANKVSFDIFDVSGEEIPPFKAANILMPIDWTKYYNIRTEMTDPDKLFIAYGGSVKVVAYNTNLVKKEDLPKTWDDLLDPKWKGKLVVDSRPKSFLHLMPAWGEQKVLDYLKKLADNKPQYRRGQSESIQLMAAGDIAIIAGSYYHSVKLVKDKGAPIDVVLLDPVPVSMSFMTIAKATPHPNAAKLFLGWMATEGEKYYDQATGRGLPFVGYETGVAKLIGDKKLSIFDYTWALREDELDKKAGQMMGLDK